MALDQKLYAAAVSATLDRWREEADITREETPNRVPTSLDGLTLAKLAAFAVLCDRPLWELVRDIEEAYEALTRAELDDAPSN